MDIYSYFRSSASYRVRIALNLKGIPYTVIPVNLRLGEHKKSFFRTMNPQGFVPLLADANLFISQSLTILEYLEKKYPSPPLLPVGDLHWLARSLAQFIACEIHPLNNLRVLNYLSKSLMLDEDARLAWQHHWLKEGLHAVEAVLANSKAPFSLTATPSWVDLLLIPQLYNARRFELDLTCFPRLLEIEKKCLKMEEFQRAMPENQIDFSP